MNNPLLPLIERNRAWAARTVADDPDFFLRLTEQQSPRYMWIGCADSRVPANEIVALAPGELFVHRNVANVVVHSDLNCLSALQFAVDQLRVEHILVVGHYGCGGVRAVLENRRIGLVDNWLHHVHDVRKRHDEWLTGIADPLARLDALCELNVLDQAANVCQTTIVQDAWARQQDLTVHGWVYRLNDGLVKDLQVSTSAVAQIEGQYESALAQVRARHGGK